MITVKKITIIGTVHGDLGACNTDRLIEILEEINPQVAFCEATPEEFPKMLKATSTFNIPEIEVERIFNQRGVTLIPIDISNPNSPKSFDNRVDSMMEFFRKIHEYNYALEFQFSETGRLGYPFLNSEICDNINKDKANLENIIVKRAGNVMLTKTLEEWRILNDKRENHWINEILDYSAKNNFQNAVLIAGSAHRIV